MNERTIPKAVAFCLSVFVIVLSPSITQAQQPSGPGSIVYANGTCTQVYPASNNQSSFQNSSVPVSASVPVKNPLAVDLLCGLIKLLLGAALEIGIPTAVLFIVYAGLKFVLAQGNSAALEQAKRNFLTTIIGIALFLGAWLLAQLIANVVNTLTQPGTGGSVSACQ